MAARDLGRIGARRGSFRHAHRRHSCRRRVRQPVRRGHAEAVPGDRRQAGDPPCRRGSGGPCRPDPAGRRGRRDRRRAGGDGAPAGGARRGHPSGQRSRRVGGAGWSGRGALAGCRAGPRRRPPVRSGGNRARSAGGAEAGAGRDPGGAGGRYAEARALAWGGARDRWHGPARRLVPGADAAGLSLRDAAGVAPGCEGSGRRRRKRPSGDRRRIVVGGRRRDRLAGRRLPSQHQADLQGGRDAIGTGIDGASVAARGHRVRRPRADRGPQADAMRRRGAA